MVKRIQITITGRVQGVFFRAYTERKANELGIVGIVKNQNNGTVFIDAQAEELSLEKLIEWCWQGSPLSSVTQVDIINIDALLSNEGFTITR